MAGPWEKYGSSPPSVIPGPPRLPPMQTPDQATGQSLQNVHTQQEIGAQPLQNDNTRVNIQQGQASIHNQAFNQNQGLRQEFNKLPQVMGYSDAIQALGGALEAPDTPQGDLSIVYAYAKAMDPGSVVREGEMAMANSTASQIQQLQQYANSIQAGKRLPPQVRLGLVETMRKRVEAMRAGYDQQRSRYSALAQQNNIPAEQIVGRPLYEAYAPLEENYIRAHGGTPKINGVPIEAPTQTQGGFDGELPRQDPTPPHAEDFRNGLYSAMRGGQIKSPTDMRNWVQQFNQQNQTNFAPQWSAKDTLRAIGAARKGQPFDVQLPKYNPDISDVRGGNNAGDTINSGVRGLADTLSLGAADKIIAGADTLFKGGTMDENLARQYKISDYDQEHHSNFRLGGQALGGLLLPMGEMKSIPQIMLKSGALGGAYGAGSSRSLADIPQNALLGAAGGAVVGGAVGAAGKGIAAMAGRGAKGVPPLVDPATGELNQPLNEMSPAQRMGEMQSFGLKTVTPGMAGGRSARVIEQGFNNLPGSAGLMEDVNSAASGELRKSMVGVADKFGSSRTLNEGGADLQRGANEWMTRADKVAGKVYDAISIPPAARAITSETTGTLEKLTGQVRSNPDLAEEVNDSTLARYLSAIRGKGLDWQGMKEFRTFIGNKAGEFRFSQDARKDAYRGLYGALSEDMRATAESLGPKQLREFERANSFYAAKENRIEKGLVRILGNDANATPEKAAAAVQAMTAGGKQTGDLRTLAEVRASTIKSGAWDEIASTLIRLGGQPNKSEGRAFQPSTFVNWYADMAESARRMLFKPELRKELDRFVAVNQQLGRVKGLNNTSGTTPTMIGSGVLAAGGVAAMTHPTALLAIVGGGITNNIMARAWTNPKFVNLVTGYARAVASGSPSAVKSQTGRLTKLAITNPELRQPIEKLLANIANDNSVSKIAASPGPASDQNDQNNR